ncbi:hypothetical protein V6N12_023381 [Hibiscus sabdariffa]|uniref:Uncharacterized protein n=1 Tax=Hibiscus sabdariffa TaxID=183260 RepID=A0ABR2FY00_9ROSI
MIATNRRRRLTTGSGSRRTVAETPGIASGSWFDVLQEESPLNVMEAGTEVVNPIHVNLSAKDVTTAETSKWTKKVTYRESNPDRRSKPVRASVISDDEVIVVSLIPRVSQSKGLKDSLPKGLKIRKGFDFQPIRRVPLADWAQSTFDRIQADIDAIRSSFDQENAMEEDGRESDSQHAFSPSSSGAKPGLLDGNRQGGSGVPSLQ